MASKVTCTCGWSWNKSDSSKKDVYVCHNCGKDNTMKNGGWLSKYQEGGELPQAQDGMLDKIYSKWPALKKLGNVTIKPDESFTKDKTGVGDIEFFSPNRPQVNYDNGYIEPHPGPGTYGVIYNPLTNNDQNIRLDMLHGMPDADKQYKRLRNSFERSVKHSDINDAMKHWYNVDKEKGQTKDGKKQWIDNYVDGQLRTLLFEGDRASQNYSDEEANELLANPKIKTKFDKLNTYLKKGEFGSSIPGSVGFTYARTQDPAPSNGPYAKKTKASAQNGQEMKFYQEGLDWKPKNISKNGSWLDKYEEGGIIEDDRGQWEYPGEITKINSNQITMQGVDYPVLGISDTGDTQMMQPGQDYTYKGKSVTEYPIMNNDDLKSKSDATKVISDYLTNTKKEYSHQEEPKPDYDRIAALPATNTGVVKDIPIPVDGGYIVKKGDTLSKIAKESGVSIDNLAKVNKIKNINVISINQKLLLPAIAQTKPLPEKYQNWDVIKNKTNTLNKLSDLSKIVSYHKSKPDEIYTVVDKKNSKLLIYQGDNLIRSFEVGTGENLGDAQTVTKVINGKTNWDSGNKSTGAGIYTISNIDPSSDSYFNLPSFNLKNEQGIEVATSIHGTPKGRRKAFNNNTVEDNRMSNGCINGQCKDLPDMYKFLKEESKLYILPEDKGNSFEIVDGKPVFRVDPKNAKKYENYVDKTGKTQKGQGVNRTTNTLVYKPIKSVFNEDKFKDDVFTAFDFNDEKEYNKTTKPFVKSLTSNKKAIMQAAQIPSDVYNELAKMSFGIYGTESNYGDTHSAVGNLARAANKYVAPKSSSSPDYKSKATTYGADEGNRSVGLTQLRWNYLNDKEKSVLKKLGITSNKDFLNPEKAAIGTTAILGVRYNEQLDSEQKKDMWKHLPAKWNKRSNYSDRVKTNSSYLNFQQLTKIN